MVEDDGQMGRRHALDRIAQELVEHVAEARHRADRQAVGLARQGRQGVIGAEDIARAVDQIDMVAFGDGAHGALDLRGVVGLGDVLGHGDGLWEEAMCGGGGAGDGRCQEGVVG